MKKMAKKKMADGGMSAMRGETPRTRVSIPEGRAMPAQSNKGGAVRGKARAAAMSGRAFANGGMATTMGGAQAPAGMPSQANFGGAMRGQERAAAMSGRTFANGGKVYKSKVVKKGSC